MNNLRQNHTNFYNVFQMSIMEDIKTELRAWNESLLANHMPRDPIEFSYWVAENLPIDVNFKLSLLRKDCVISRLRCELRALKWVPTPFFFLAA